MDDEILRESTSFRDWGKLGTELLALIFKKLDPQDWIVRTVPFVCKSWDKVLRGPDCWVHIDIERWCHRVADVTVVDSAVGELVRRSSGLAKGLNVCKLGNTGFIYACTSGSCLEALKMPMSSVNDQTFIHHIKSLSMLTKLDISKCHEITSKSIELIGNECKSLVEFKRNMLPPSYEYIVVNTVPDESEALAVANTMHGIKHLELAYGRFGNHGFDAVVSQCKNLVALDVRGCWNVDWSKEYEDRLRHIEDFQPLVVDVIDVMTELMGGQVTFISF